MTRNMTRISLHLAEINEPRRTGWNWGLIVGVVGCLAFWGLLLSWAL